MSKPDEPSDDGVPAASSTPPGKRASRKPAQRGILAIGFVLNGIYEVKRLLARGGMGEVYEGVNVNADERVAIKVILPHLAADPKVQALFRKEAKTLTSLAHPALVQYRVLAREPRKDLLYIVTDFIDGEPLSNLIGRGRPTTYELVMITRRLAEGLGAAHSHGAIHRDMSPDNVLLPGGVLSQAKIIDFGIAKSMDVGAQTVVGDGFAGKLGYVAPEQFGDFGRRIGPWTDIYSLGLVVLTLAGGSPPDMGTTLVEAIDRRRAGPVLSMLPEILQPLFGRMLSPNPDNRPQSMAEVLVALDALDVPFEPPSAFTQGAPEAADDSAEDSGDDSDAARTIVGGPLSSPPGSWAATAPAASTATPASSWDAPATQPPASTAASWDAPAPAAAGAKAASTAAPADPAKTVFAPSPLRPTLPPTEPAAPPAKVEAEAPGKSPAPAPPPAPKAAEPPKVAKPPKPPKPPKPTPAPKAASAPSLASAGTDAVAARKGPPWGVIAGGVGALMVAVLAVVFWPKGQPAAPAATAGAASAPTAGAAVASSGVQDAVAAALPRINCSWLAVDPSSSASNIKISGVAPDPAAVNKAAAAAASGAQVDTTAVQTAPASMCRLLDTARTFRAPPSAMPGLVPQQASFEISRAPAGCPNGLWAQSVVDVSTDPSKSFTLVAVQPSGRLQQLAADRAGFATLAAQSPGKVKDLGGGRYSITTCQAEPGLTGLLMIQGAGPFDLGLKPGAVVRAPANFPDHLLQLAQAQGWTMQMAWFQLVNNQPDLPAAAATTVAAAAPDATATAAVAAAAAAAVNQIAAAAPAPPAPATPAPPVVAVRGQNVPADWYACRRYVNGAWDELGYASQAACIQKIFTGHCEVQTGQAGDVALRRYNGFVQSRQGKLFKNWTNLVAAEQCPAK